LFAQIKRPKVHQEIVAQLENLIISGRLKEGERLPSERELMAQFNVGRPAVREAILSLERSGLLRISNGERALVVQPTTEKVLDSLSSAVRVSLSTEEGVRNFQAARRLFEVAIVRHAAAHVTDEHVGRLRQALAANEEAMGDSARFEVTDVAFHFEIARTTGNPIFTGLHEALTAWLLQQRNVVLREPTAERLAYEAHRNVFRAIERRDPDAAEAAMTSHLDAVETEFWKQRRRETRKRKAQ
jgi:GntR family transcriptional repressor for pyruvate dehydrogenase complex